MRRRFLEFKSLSSVVGLQPAVLFQLCLVMASHIPYPRIPSRSKSVRFSFRAFKIITKHRPHKALKLKF